jgi:hypothetical protein
MSSRVRTEDGEAVLDVRLTNVERIFDNRDPAPFRERALDPDFVDYLIEGAHDRAAAGRIRIVVWLAQPCAPGEIEQAVQTHFEQALERTQRKRREQLRTAWIALAVAAIAVVVLMGLGELVAKNVVGTLGSGLREALVISGWVLMWRPIDVLIYDSIPWRRERRILRALREARIDVRTGEEDKATSSNAAPVD